MPAIIAWGKYPTSGIHSSANQTERFIPKNCSAPKAFRATIPTSTTTYPPTRVKKVEKFADVQYPLEEWQQEVQRHHHLKTRTAEARRRCGVGTPAAHVQQGSW